MGDGGYAEITGCTAVIGQDVVIELLGLGRPTKALIWPALLSKSLKKRPW